MESIGYAVSNTCGAIKHNEGSYAAAAAAAVYDVMATL